MPLSVKIQTLQQTISGDVFTDMATRLVYATDASVYREVPIAVVKPRNKEDILCILKFALDERVSLIPRGAGTSLAGQVVGGGIVVDVSRYMNKILEIDVEAQWIWVEPGVVLDELNAYLEQFGLFFGPETSTSNRCNIGGMVGNNSCGARSLVYGSTRDHLLEVVAYLSDSSEVIFKALSLEQFYEKCEGDTLENKLYYQIHQILSNPDNQERITSEYPDKSIHRRNNGYALDILLETEPFGDGCERFNFCKLLAGSEGTLAFMTKIKLNLVRRPPKKTGLLCVHLESLEESFHANLISLEHKPMAIELMDSYIMACTKNHIIQRENRFFIQGDPSAILIVEFANDNENEIIRQARNLEAHLRSKKLGYHFPLVMSPDTKKVWDLRKAGLGLLSNIPGDAKPVAVIEDTAINPEFLNFYIREFKEILEQYELNCVFYAHIATGELHLRPVLNLKNRTDVVIFKELATDIAKLVKDYNGSLSGEHGDGRLRGEFIPFMLGEHNYQLIKEIKNKWDPSFTFNPGKIVDTPPMQTSLRYEPDQTITPFKTHFNFSETLGLLRASENCNGSADCRKSHQFGGLMCPSYMATKDEMATTRARANIIREYLTNSKEANPLNHKEIYDVLDLCLLCKGCKSECPSSVDMAKIKMEFLQHWYDNNPVPKRNKLIRKLTTINAILAKLPGFANILLSSKLTSWLPLRMLDFSTARKLPKLQSTTLRKWTHRHLSSHNPKANRLGKVFLFADEFTEYYDTDIGIKAILLLTRLGYEVEIATTTESGRALLSKGLIRAAKIIAVNNIIELKDKVSPETPLIGIEPSTLLVFRDEYPDLMPDNLRDIAKDIARSCLMIDEFLACEMKKGKIERQSFTKEKKHIKLHGHCHQKALASTDPTILILSFPENYTVEEIKSGCCGMSGSFGYEKDHYELSMQIGEMVLFPAVRNSAETDIIAAPGTSCRHQIHDGTKRKALHPVVILHDALIW